MSVALPAWYGEFYSCRRHWSCTRIKATLHTGLTRQARSKYWNAIDDWQIVHIHVLLYSSTCLVNMNHQVQFCLQSVLQVTLPWPIKVNVTKSSANRIIDKIYYLLTYFLLHFHFCFSFACIIDRRDSYICQIFACKKHVLGSIYLWQSCIYPPANLYCQESSKPGSKGLQSSCKYQPWKWNIHKFYKINTTTKVKYNIIGHWC